MQLLEDVPFHWGFDENHIEASQGKLVELTEISHHVTLAVFMESPGTALGKTADLLTQESV